MHIREFLVLNVLLLGSFALTDSPVTLPTGPLETDFAELSSAKGQDYVAARGRMLAQDKTAILDFLQARKRGADPVQQLCIEALVARVRDGTRLDSALAAAFEFAKTPYSRNIRGELRFPDSYRIAQFLVERLGDDAYPLATELLVKGVAGDWPVEKREVLLAVLYIQGRQRLSDGSYSQIKDPRAGEALFRFFMNEPNKELKDLAKRLLRAFASPDLVKTVRSTREKEQSEEGRHNLEQIAQSLEREARIRSSTTRPTSLPSSVPAGSPKQERK
jgi:hypothetical protein